MSAKPQIATLEEILVDFPPGPLDRYRKRATFDWKALKVYWEGEDVVKFKVLFSSVTVYFIL